MKRLFAIALLAASPSLASTNEVAALTPKRNLLWPVSVTVTPEVRSAYVSRAKVVEDRPMQILYSQVDVDAGEFGRFGMWNRDISSLTSRRDYAHHRAFNEIDWALLWHYDIEIAEGWKLSSEPQKSWNTYHGYKPGYRSAEHSMNEWRFIQSLENQYIVPYWMMRTCVHPYRWSYFQPGLRRRFKLPNGFSVMPRAFAELGDDGLFRNRYGAKPADCSYDNGLAALGASVELAWKWTDNFTFFVELAQFDLVSDEARQRVKDSEGNPSARRDLTYWSIGVRCRF